MKKLFIVVAVVVALILLAFFGGGMLLPSSFEVEREARIAAPPTQLYTAVGHLDTWPEWTPWNEEHYSGLAIEFPGSTEGVGAEQRWTIEDSSGRLVITSAEPARGISYTLVFDEQLEIEGIVEFTEVAAEGELPAGTNVRWLQRGALDGVLHRWIGLTLDRSLGGDIEAALEGLEDRVARGE